jgi:hypothetical protein
MQGLLGMAVAGIDMALWDALGKVFNQPVATLLGGAPVALRAYDSYGMVDPRKDEAALRKSVAAGFPGIKIKLGYPDPSDDVAVVRGVRGIIGSDAELMVDFNQSLDPPEACRRIQRLQEFDLYWVEEPVAAEDLAGHAQVRRITGCRVQTGENWWFPRGLGAAISASACDFAMLDIMKIGGVTGWMRAAGQAQAASLPVSSHLFVEASAHTLAVTPTADWLEYLDIALPIGATRWTGTSPRSALAWASPGTRRPSPNSRPERRPVGSAGSLTPRSAPGVDGIGCRRPVHRAASDAESGERVGLASRLRWAAAAPSSRSPRKRGPDAARTRRDLDSTTPTDTGNRRRARPVALTRLTGSSATYRLDEPERRQADQRGRDRQQHGPHTRTLSVRYIHKTGHQADP